MTEPKWFELAKKEIGTKEGPGTRNNPTVQKYYGDAGAGVQQDSVPWCAAFVGAMLKRAGVEPSGSLMARSYLNWGTPLKSPVPGCVVVFSRGQPPSGHVAFYEKDVGSSVQVVGGNQSDSVKRATYPKARILGYRWPAAIATPAPVISPSKKGAPRRGDSIGMDLETIKSEAQRLHSEAATISSISAARKAAGDAAALIFYLAKIVGGDKSTKKSLRTIPRKKPRGKPLTSAQKRARLIDKNRRQRKAS